MNPEVADAIHIADRFLDTASLERRKALALAIQDAIIRHARIIAAEMIADAVKNRPVVSLTSGKL